MQNSQIDFIQFTISVALTTITQARFSVFTKPFQHRVHGGTTDLQDSQSFPIERPTMIR